MRPAASGEQFELRRGNQRAVVVEVGGGLREYEVAGDAVLDGYVAGSHADGARGQPLAPWPNRLRDGRYEWDGEIQQLPLSEPAHSNAIHGLVRWRNWRPIVREEASVTMALRLHPMSGYPFTVDLSIAYALEDSGLCVRSRAVNLGDRACPFGIGFHPYLTVGDGLDATRLTVSAERMLLSDERSIPTGSAAVEGTPFDFRAPRQIGSTVLDTCYCELARDGAGRARIVLAGRRRAVALWMDERYRFAMVYSGDTLAADRRRRSLAVEPMSCAPNAFASGDGLVRLEPDAAHVAEWGIEPL